MAETQSIVPPHMGYVGSNNNDAILGALAASALNRTATPYSADSFGGTGGGLVSALLLSSMLGRRGFGADGDCGDNKIILADIRKDIGDAKTESVKAALEAKIESCKTESEIQKAIQAQDTNNQINFRALDNRICETEKAAIINAKDAQIKSLEVEARTADRITSFERTTAENFCDVKRDISGVNTNLEKVNTHLTHMIDSTTCKLEFQAERNKGELALQIERGFCQSREEALKDELAELRASKRGLEQTLQFSNQLVAINSAIADLSQSQRLTNQTIQFGQGNLAGQSATNNQVR